jgi:hypothetical protein
MQLILSLDPSRTILGEPSIGSGVFHVCARRKVSYLLRCANRRSSEPVLGTSCGWS